MKAHRDQNRVPRAQDGHWDKVLQSPIIPFQNSSKRRWPKLESDFGRLRESDLSGNSRFSVLSEIARERFRPWAKGLFDFGRFSSLLEISVAIASREKEVAVAAARWGVGSPKPSGKLTFGARMHGTAATANFF